MADADANLTLLLHAAAQGDRHDLDALLGAIYDDLRRLASVHMKEERRDHTLQPTALVHEAYVRLIDQRSTDWKDRVHFFAIASQVIRRILVDHARASGAQKRGGGRERLPMEHLDVLAGRDALDVSALDDALRELADLDETQARIVELRFFGGLTIEEIAELLSIGKRSVDREWSCAKAWLYARLRRDEDHDATGPNDA